MRNLVFRLRRWQFNVGAAVSLALLLVTAVNSYLSFDRSHIFQIAHVDFVFQFSTLRIHHVLPPEQAWRDQVAERETIEQWFENRRMQIDRDVQREPWDTPAYHAALARFRDWRTVYDVYQKSLKPLGTWKESGVVVPLVWLMIPEAVLPSLAIYLWWRRWRQRIRRAIGRHIRYVPYAQLTGFQRLRRVTVVTASAFCSLLAVATTVLWVRSYWVGDAYSQLMVVGPVGSDGHVYRQLVIERGIVFASSTRYQKPSKLVPGSIEEANAKRIHVMLTQQRLGTGSSWRQFVPTGSSSPAWPAIRVSHQATVGRSYVSVQLHCWSFVLLFALLPAAWLLLRLLSEHTVAGHCPRCDYDLTGNTSGICPECGTTVSEPVKA